MKKVFIIAALTLTLSVAIWSCKKDETPTAPGDNTLPTEQPAALGDSLGILMDNPTMSDASMTADLDYESYPAFLETDYFSLAVVQGANGGANLDSINKICCGSFKLTKEQKEKLVAAHKAKEDCMDANRKILKNIDAEIKTWAKTTKENIIAKTKLQMDSINKLYDSGVITAAQRKEMGSKLELQRAAILKGLSAKVKDKIAANVDRAIASGKIKDCEKIYLKSIKEILTAEQFQKWVSCFKEKYKKK